MKTVTTVDQNNSPDLFASNDIMKPAVDLKGSVFTLTVLRLQSHDMAAIEKELQERLALGPRFFEDAPVVIDLDAVKEQDQEIDFKQLGVLLRGLRLIPVGVRHANSAQQQQALAAGLALMKGGAIKDIGTPTAKPAPAQVAKEPVQAKMSDIKVPDQAAGESTSKIIYQPIRSGQQIYAKGGDLIVLGAVNAGAEIIADGNIHVYAPLRGRALAGVRGNKSARIFCHHMEAQLVSVCGHYRVFEDTVPSDIRNKAVQIYLDNDQLKIDLL